MSVDYPDHLYIRVERSLQTALAEKAAASGLTVSEFARRELRSAMGKAASLPIYSPSHDARPRPAFAGG